MYYVYTSRHETYSVDCNPTWWSSDFAGSMSSAHVRKEVLSTYRRILRLAWSWRATVPSQTEEEQAYIKGEARTLFRRNKNVSEWTALPCRLPGVTVIVVVYVIVSAIKLTVYTW